MFLFPGRQTLSLRRAGRFAIMKAAKKAHPGKKDGLLSMKDYTRFVNVFQGCDEIALPTPQGIAATWELIKGLCGNNTPGAALPFGRLTACCYSGGYSSGYGRLRSNSHGPIGKLFDHNQFKGIAHIQQDGTGYIDTFYNYAVVSPYTGALAHSADPRDFDGERAEPGYYACRDSLSGADCEVTVTPRAALHRISFPGEGGRISVDFSNDGLYDDGNLTRSPAGGAMLSLISGGEVAVEVELHKLRLWFYLKAEGLTGPMRLWLDGRETDAQTLTVPPGHTFGVTMPCASQARLTLGLSPKSAEIARADAVGNALSFDEARAQARAAWAAALGRIDAEFDDPTDHEIFYSNLYHTLIKPADWSGESFLYAEEPFVLDFATLWDQYKTSLPLIYTLYPDMGRKIADTFLRTARATGKMIHTLLLDGMFLESTTGQARMLAEHTLVDAWLRGVDFDLDEALRLMHADVFEHGYYDAFLQGELPAAPAFAIDMTDACAACAMLARARGRADMAAEFDAVAGRWAQAFDPETGLVRMGERFYEGTNWNYSFRLMHDMAGRVALAGGKERFAQLLDVFFGFETRGREASFEGFNNETDMESPYAYHFCGRHDRLAEVIHAGFTSMFTTGRGGVPGNSDSGGLTGCYIWNALGIFPASGQDLMIIGSPRVRRAVLHMHNGRDFVIEKQGDGIYVQEALLDGRPLPSLAFSVRRMLEGGCLTLRMGKTA